MDDLISMIIPIYKVEGLLDRCVGSILGQTYKNIEVILVDDGSPDKCGELCDQYALKDRRVRVIHKRNGGLSDARNAGIEVAKGDFIAFVDSDDWVSKNYIEVLYDLLIARDADISVCNFIRTSTELMRGFKEEENIHEFSNIQALENLYGTFYQQLTIACGKLYKKSLFEDIRFPVGKIHEDEFTTYKLLYKANKIVLTTKIMLYYWQREDSIMGEGFNLKNRLHVIEAFEERASFFDSIGQKNLKEKTLRALFEIYRLVNDNIHLFENAPEKNRFLENFKRYILCLENSEQTFAFTRYYKLYLKFPNITNKLYYLFKNISFHKTK